MGKQNILEIKSKTRDCVLLKSHWKVSNIEREVFSDIKGTFRSAEFCFYLVRLTTLVKNNNNNNNNNNKPYL